MIYRYLNRSIPSHIQHVVITSDSTVAQNRNQFITSLLLVAVQCLPQLQTIEQKFLEPGHTEMEVDSMHSTIDRARKRMRISCPYEWPVVLQTARRDKPYHVFEIEREEFFELHKLPRLLNAEQALKAVPWMKVRCVRVTKGMTTEIEIKLDYSSEYQKVPLQKALPLKTRRTNSSRRSEVNIDVSLLKPAYPNQLPISKAKKADLMGLCSSGVINKRFHDYYNQIQTSDTVRDCLPEPDYTEDWSEATEI